MSQITPTMEEAFARSEKTIAQEAYKLCQTLQDRVYDSKDAEEIEVYIPLTKQILDLVTLLTDYSNKELADQIDTEGVDIDFLYELRRETEGDVKAVNRSALLGLLEVFIERLAEWAPADFPETHHKKTSLEEWGSPNIHFHGNVDIDTVVVTEVNSNIDNPDKKGKIESDITIDNLQDNDEDLP